MQAARDNAAAPTQRPWSKVALLIPFLILLVAPGHKHREEGLDRIREEIRKRLALAEKRNLEPLLNDAIEDQEKQKQQESGSKGPGATDTEDENDRFLKAAKAADRRQLRTAATLLRGSKLLPPTEATADAIEQLYQTSDAAQKRTNAALEPFACLPKSDVRQQHILTHIRDAKRQAHPGPSGERNSHTSALLLSPRSFAILTKWVQLRTDKKLDEAFTEPWLQATVVGLRPSRGDAPQAGDIICDPCEPVSQVRRAARSYQCGIYHEGGPREIAWEIHAEMAAEPTKVSIACDIKNGFGAARRSDAVEGATKMVPGAGTDLCQLVGRKRRSTTDSLGERTERELADRGERWFSPGCMRGTSCLCSRPAGGADGI